MTKLPNIYTEKPVLVRIDVPEVGSTSDVVLPSAQKAEEHYPGATILGYEDKTAYSAAAVRQLLAEEEAAKQERATAKAASEEKAAQEAKAATVATPDATPEPTPAKKGRA